MGEELSAKPFHDWNERITSECYQPNTEAPILNSKGEVVECVNNFEKISFDIGPTLLSWLKRKAPETYFAIVDADKKSVRKHGGRGNAMAQCYNHLIMPLATRRDKITQVRWGIRDFEFHFKRKPEGMWLPEAAVDKESLKIMRDEGIRFTVLAPHQALKVRPIGFGRRWDFLHHEAIDSKRPYRIVLDRGHQFHIFFYDAPISQGIAFQGLLMNGDHLLHRLFGAFSHGPGAQLVTTATDGESFGHHHRFGEMAIAYAAEKIEKQRLVHLTNFAEFLARFGSGWEVDIHEQSSWSCAHGVGRWKEDCGCRFNFQEGWNQKWRGSLREAFDFLKEKIDHRFEEKTESLLKDPWQARNAFIDVVLDPGDESRKKFLSREAKRRLNTEEEKKVWDLLEAERFSMLMFTSCGWFFDDISGIEPVQVMRFAARAMELLTPYETENLEAPFLKILAGARSNFPEHGTGADIFNRWVKPHGL